MHERMCQPVAATAGGWVGGPEDARMGKLPGTHAASPCLCKRMPSSLQATSAAANNRSMQLRASVPLKGG